MKIEMGKKYQTRDGRAVRLLALDGPRSEQPVCGFIEGCPDAQTWGRDGKYYTWPGESPPDLVEVPEPKPSTTLYAAAAKTSSWGTANYVTSKDKDQVELHARRIGPVVEVALPRDPPAKPKFTVARIESREGAPDDTTFLDVMLSNGGRYTTRVPFEVEEHVTLVPAGTLAWVDGDTKPEVGRTVLAKCVVRRSYRSDIEFWRSVKWVGDRWCTESCKSLQSMVRIKKWAYFNEEG